MCVASFNYGSVCRDGLTRAEQWARYDHPEVAGRRKLAAEIGGYLHAAQRKQAARLRKWNREKKAICAGTVYSTQGP